MRPAYAGTHLFAGLVFDGLLASRHRPVVLITNPDRRRGRHATPQPPDIKLQAETAGIPVLQPERLSSPEGVAALRACGADVLVVCAYGEILQKEVLDAVTTVAVHPAVLPRWRGAAPVERALMAGETSLGVSVLRVTAGVDEGPVGVSLPVEIPRDADAGEAYRRLAPAAVRAVETTLDRLAAGTIVWEPQKGAANYAAKLDAADRRIDWARPAAVIADQIRALAPRIGAVTELLGRRTLIWRAAPGDGPLPTEPGKHLVMPAGQGWLEILELQQEGRRRMTADEFLRGAGRALEQA